MAKDKLTSDMGTRKSADIINKELEENDIIYTKGNIIWIEKTAVNRYLKNSLGRPKKVRRVFYLKDKQKKEWLKFYEIILNKRIKGE